MFKNYWQIILLPLFGGLMTGVWAQAVTVVEYYNKPLDAYFISGRIVEQQQLDLLTDFQRTGMSFQALAAIQGPTPPADAAGNARVCRFYVSTVSPYANSHFYGLESTECDPLLARNLPGFTWEGYDFALQQPVGGVCPANTTTIYRSFRAAAGGKTPNHRYSASAASYVASANVGYSAEQAVFCATAATDIAVLTTADCGTFYYHGVRVGYQSLTDGGLVNNWVRFMGATGVAFNGGQAQPVIEQYSTGQSRSLMIEESVGSWTELGMSVRDSSGEIQSYYLPPTAFARQMSAGQTISMSRYVAYSPIQNFGSPQQTGTLTLIGTELVSVATGIYATCKFSSDTTTQYDAIGRSVIERATTWVAPGVGIVKATIKTSTDDEFGPSPPAVMTEVNVVSVQRL